MGVIDEFAFGKFDREYEIDEHQGARPFMAKDGASSSLLLCKSLRWVSSGGKTRV